MVEEKTIYTFDQPLTRYQFSDINLTIVSGYPPMSEDEPTPEPTPTPPEPEPEPESLELIKTFEDHSEYSYTIQFPQQELPNMQYGTSYNTYASVAYADDSYASIAFGILDYDLQNSTRQNYSLERMIGGYSANVFQQLHDFYARGIILYNFDRSKFYSSLTGGTVDINSTFTFDKCIHMFSGTNGNTNPYLNTTKFDIYNNQQSNFYYHADTDILDKNSEGGTKCCTGSQYLTLFNSANDSCLVLTGNVGSMGLKITNASKYIPSLLTP